MNARWLQTQLDMVLECTEIQKTESRSAKIPNVRKSKLKKCKDECEKRHEMAAEIYPPGNAVTDCAGSISLASCRKNGVEVLGNNAV